MGGGRDCSCHSLWVSVCFFFSSSFFFLFFLGPLSVVAEFEDEQAMLVKQHKELLQKKRPARVKEVPYAEYVTLH